MPGEKAKLEVCAIASRLRLVHNLSIKSVVALGLVFLTGTSALPGAPGSFTGSYTNDLDSLGTGGTAMPAGFSALVLSGNNATYGVASPITAAAIAGAVASSSQSLTVWNAGGAVASSSTTLFNRGSFGNINDRALGTDPTSVGAMVVELALTNSTGTNLPGVIFSYAVKCLTNGTGGSGTESADLPGYSFFYSLTGGATAAD